MSIPMLLSVLVFGIVIAAAAGVWRARGTGATGTQSALTLLLVVVAAAVVLWMVFRGR